MSDQIELQQIIGQVAAAYFNNNHVTPSEIPTVIGNIATSISAVGAAPAPAPAPAEEAVAPAEEPEHPKLTAAQIRRSITPDKLISFEDGKGYKTLRRHLAAKGLTPEEYRTKWGLPKDYPMASPNYSEARSNMAKARGFGRPAAPAPTPPAPAAAEAAAPAPSVAAAPAKRAAPKKRAAAVNGKAQARGRPRNARKAAEPTV